MSMSSVPLAQLRKSYERAELDELKKKDFTYVHLELPDEVVYDPDVKAKVRAIEAVDKEFVGPFLDGLVKLGPHRLVTISDPGSVHQGKMAEGQWLYAYQDSAAKSASGAGRRCSFPRRRWCAA